MATIPSKARQNSYKTYVIDVAEPLEASLFDTAGFVQFLVESYKPFRGSKAGNVGLFSAENTKEQNLAAYAKSVIISSNAAQTKVLIHSKVKVSKAYLKYLTKKYLKKNELRDYVRVLAPTKLSLRLVFISVAGQDEEEEEEVAEEAAEEEVVTEEEAPAAVEDVE